MDHTAYIQGDEESFSMPDGHLILTGSFSPWPAGHSIPVKDLNPCEGDSLENGVFHFRGGVRFTINHPKLGPIVLDCREARTYYCGVPPKIARDPQPERITGYFARPKPNRVSLDGRVCGIRSIGYVKLY